MKAALWAEATFTPTGGSWHHRLSPPFLLLSLAVLDQEPAQGLRHATELHPQPCWETLCRMLANVCEAASKGGYYRGGLGQSRAPQLNLPPTRTSRE